MSKLNFDNTFAKLSSDLYTKMKPEGFSKTPFLVHNNKQIEKQLGIAALSLKEEDYLKLFSCNDIFENSDPLAMAYSGHQFGAWAGQLGDGRALLLGQIRSEDNQLYDLQLKGSGLTPYSRMGDGRAVMRSSIREYLCSAAMQGLGIPTSSALCLIGTNEQVQRERLEPGAVVARVSKSFIRFGHFEHCFYNERADLTKELADYVIKENFLGLNYEEWLSEVVTRTAKLIAAWQAVGFAHGVMNTDNMSVVGETIDYGPFGFMEEFNPGFICNHSDHQGRYAFAAQPDIAYWNLQAFAYSLQSLVPLETAKEILKSFHVTAAKEYQFLMSKKLGFSESTKECGELLKQLLELMQKNKADYALTFRKLSELDSQENANDFLLQFNFDEEVKIWLEAFLKAHSNRPEECKKMMLKTNPKFILRNWVAEVAIRAAEDQKNYKNLDDLMTILANPYVEHLGFEHFADKAPFKMKGLAVSCSS